MILFGLLDSHSQFTDYANMRIDNFVYTEESFREAREHLRPEWVGGVEVSGGPSLAGGAAGENVAADVRKSSRRILARSHYATSATCFVVSPGDRVEEALAADPRLAQFVQEHAVQVGDRPVPLTTDDWPYLYQEGHWIPRTYYSVGLLVILIAIALYWQIGEARRVPSLFFFSMGAGFLLLETQVISRLALFFGTIWQVNGIVISALLIALLIANWIVDRRKQPSLKNLDLGRADGRARAGIFVPVQSFRVADDRRYRGGVCVLLAGAVRRHAVFVRVPQRPLAERRSGREYAGRSRRRLAGKSFSALRNARATAGRDCGVCIGRNCALTAHTEPGPMWIHAKAALGSLPGAS